MQGGLIALHAAFQKQTLFAGIVLSAANVEVDPKVAGWFTVRAIKCNVCIVAGCVTHFNLTSNFWFKLLVVFFPRLESKVLIQHSLAALLMRYENVRSLCNSCSNGVVQIQLPGILHTYSAYIMNSYLN